MTGTEISVAHGAVRAVAADDEARRDPGAVRGRDDHRVVTRFDAGYFDAATHVHAERARPPFEQLLERGLVEHRRRGPARRAVAGPTEPQQRRTRAVAPLVDVGRLADRTELGADAARLEDAADLVVEVHRARKRVRLRPSLEHGDGAPSLREQDRECAADRAVADDRDVDGLRRAVHAERSGWWPQALIAVVATGCRPIRR